MTELPINRLRCSDCKAFQSITDFPFKHRYTCIKCKDRRANQRIVQLERRQIRVQKETEKKEKERQWQIETNESA